MNLSVQESDLLSRLAAKGKSIFSTDEAEEVWQGSTSIHVVLHRLEKKGWLQRLDRGVYLLIPLEAGPDRFWSESPLVIASHLIQPGAVAYWSALHYWQMTEQLPRITYVQSTKRKQPLEVQGMPFQFVTVKESRYFGIADRQINEQKFKISDREKTLIDCANRPDLSGGMIQLGQALKHEYAHIDWDKLSDYFERWGGGAVVKRIGYLVDVLDVPVPDRERRLIHWKSLLTRGISLLEPGAGNEGSIVTAWQIQVNIPGLISGER